MRFKRFFLLYENLSITGVKITPEESISSAAIRNKKTGEIIEGDFHYDAQRIAWEKGVYAQKRAITKIIDNYNISTVSVDVYSPRYQTLKSAEGDVWDDDIQKLI